MSENASRTRPAGSRVGDGEIETSGAEKVLAVVLAVFIAIGAVWGYVKLDDVGETDPASSYLPDRQLIDAEELSAIQQPPAGCSLGRRGPVGPQGGCSRVGAAPRGLPDVARRRRTVASVAIGIRTRPRQARLGRRAS